MASDYETVVVEVIALLLILCRCFSERFSFLPMMMIPPINIPTRPPSTSSGRRSIPGQSLSLSVRKVLFLLLLLIAGQILFPSLGQLFIWPAMQRTVTLDGDSRGRKGKWDNFIQLNFTVQPLPAVVDYEYYSHTHTHVAIVNPTILTHGCV